MWFVYLQSDKAVYVVTEKAIPLESYLTELKGNEKNFNAEHLLEIAWGLQQLCVRMQTKIFHLKIIDCFCCSVC